MNRIDLTREAQQARLLKWLKEKPITSLEARRELEILSPAARIYEARHHHGYNIKTNWKYDNNPNGARHRVAEYVLLPGRYKGGKSNAK